MISVMSNIAVGKDTNNRWQKIVNLKTRAKVLIFLQNNNISDMSQLVNKIESINEEYKELADKIKPVERRLVTLTQHLAQYENYKTHKTIYDKYKQLNPKKQEAFYDKYSEKIELFKTAQQYLTAIMNGKTTIPEKAWQAEQQKLTTYRFSLCEKYYELKDEIRNVELLCKGADNIMREEARDTPVRKQVVELE